MIGKAETSHLPTASHVSKKPGEVLPPLSPPPPFFFVFLSDRDITHEEGGGKKGNEREEVPLVIGAKFFSWRWIRPSESISHEEKKRGREGKREKAFLGGWLLLMELLGIGEGKKGERGGGTKPPITVAAVRSSFFLPLGSDSTRWWFSGVGSRYSTRRKTDGISYTIP